MSALGQKQTSGHLESMSALPPKADVAERDRHIPFWHKADMEHVQSIRFTAKSEHLFNGQTDSKEDFAQDFVLPRPRVQCGDADGLMKQRLPPGVVAARELSPCWTLAAAVREITAPAL